MLCGAGAAAVAVLLAMGVTDSRDPAPRFPLPVLILVGIAAVLLIAGGVSQLVVAQRVAAGAPDEPVSYRHTYRLFVVLGAGIVLALAVRGLAVPSDFGLHGYYRAGARDDAARAREPRYQGAALCADCHAEEHEALTGDVHHTVQCETCHGPADLHVAADAPKDHPPVAEKAAGACLTCHRLISGRPGPFPQIVPADHFKLVGAKDGTACTSCHDAHQPIFLSRPLAQARLHPLVHRCRDCHVGRTDATLTRPAAHPAIFECGYCHGKLSADFPARRHGAIACATCHLFVRASEFAGRIVRNTSPRFCLLCHGAGAFRREGPGVAATIDWAEHRKTYDETLPADAPCTPCHADTLHGELTAGGSTP